MYSILEKDDGIIKFLADSDKDLIKIIDVCKPGSTVEVLSDEIHTFIKSPSGQWVIYEGQASEGFSIPKNDAKVSVPAAKESFQGSLTKTIGDYQKDIKIYKTGLVTGTLLNAEVEKDIGYPPDQLIGHYVTVKLEAPKNAKNYTIWTMDQQRGEEHSCDDNMFTVRMENMTEDKKITIKYDTKESFEFILDDLILE